jgi:hypothetical protein
MKTQYNDTCAEAEKVLISLLRKENFSKKLSRILSFSQTMIRLSKRAIARANENLDAGQISLLFIKYHYGGDLAERVKRYLEEDRNEKP